MGIDVFNTPASSSQAVAELVMSVLFAAARGVYDSGRNMHSADGKAFDTLQRGPWFFGSRHIRIVSL
jgi:D-3-phosphoglycerate dehydrogenase